MVFKKLLIIVFILIPFTVLFAQETPAEETDAEEELNYYLDLSGKEPRFVQRLSWQGDEYALRYVLIIQRLGESGSYIEVEKKETQSSTAEVSLIAGLYRYSVEVYDLFDDHAFTTDWHNFEVIRAIQPHFSSFSPGHFYLDEDEEWVITISGNNFLPQTVFQLRQDRARITPVRVTLEENGARLEFSPASLYPGKFIIYARNPGGLDHSIETFNISNKKRFDLNIFIGYAPIIPVMGYLFEDGFSYENNPSMEAPFIDPFYPLSGSVRISFLPVKRTWGNIGVDVSASYTILSCDRELYSTNANLLNIHAGFLYQKHFLKRTFFINLSAGGGVFSVMDFYYSFSGKEQKSTTNTFISAIGGLSFTYIFKKPWAVTAGADYIHAFPPPNPDSPMPAVIRPYIMAGIQL